MHAYNNFSQVWLIILAVHDPAKVSCSSMEYPTFKHAVFYSDNLKAFAYVVQKHEYVQLPTKSHFKYTAQYQGNRLCAHSDNTQKDSYRTHDQIAHL